MWHAGILVYINTFCHFINSVVAKFYDRMILSTQHVYGDQYLYLDTLSR